MSAFNYHEAFSRNIGWLSREEQEVLRTKRVAMAGMGGVGGDHAIRMARLGVGNFSISDLDVFEQANFNRQYGATMATVGEAKVDVMRNTLAAINPEADIRVFPEGINKDNAEAFLEGVDLYIDSLDFFYHRYQTHSVSTVPAEGNPSRNGSAYGNGYGVSVLYAGQYEL